MSKARVIMGPGVGPAILSRDITVPLQDFSNKYDEFYRPGYNQEWNRSENQSGLAQLGLGLTSRTLSIIPKLGAGLGSIYGAGLAIKENELSKIWDNPVVGWFNELDEQLKETLPVYRSEDYSTGDLLGKLGTTSFWANDAFDGFAYAASAAVPGLIFGKAIQGTSALVRSTDLGKRVLGGLNKIGANSHRANLTISTAYNTISESAAEAYQTQKELEAIYEDQGFDPQHAKLKAAEAAARVFRGNMAALAIPNLIQNTMFHGGWNSIQKATKQAIWASKNADEIKYLDSLWSKVGKGFVSEGIWEENIQTSMQQWEKNAALIGKNTDHTGLEIGSNFVNNIAGFFGSFMPGHEETADQVEGATSIFLGGLIGGGMGAMSYRNEKKQFKKYKEAELTRYKELFDIYGEAAKKLFIDNVGSLYKTKGTKVVKQGDKEFEVPNYVLDDQNNPIIDEEALNRFGVNSMRNKHLWDAQALAGYRNDPAMAELNKQMALASFVNNLMSSKYQYTAEEINALLDQHTEIGTEEAKALGIDTYIKDNMDQAKSYAKQLESIKSKRASIAKEQKADLQQLMFDDFANKTEFYLNVKRKALENISKQVESETAKETVSKLIEDVDSYLNEFRNNFSEIRKEYDKTVSTREAKIGRLKAAKQANKLEEVAKINYELLEDAYINGNWTGINSSRGLTTQEASEGATADRIPGSRDFYAYNSGKSLLTIERTAKAIESQESIIEAAFNFVNGIKVTPKGYEDVVAEQKATIEQKLSDEVDSRVAEINFNEAVEEALRKAKTTIDYMEPNEDGEYASLSEVFADSGIDELGEQEEILKILNGDLGKFELNSAFAEVANSVEFVNLLNLIQESNRARGQELLRLQDLLEALNNFDTNQGFLKDYEQASDKEIFLKKDYYNNKFGEPAKNFIKYFEKDSENFLDDVKLSYHIANLKVVVLATDIDSIREEAQKLLDKLLNEVAPQIAKNLDNQLAIQKVINNKIVWSILEALPLNDASSLASILSPEAIDFINKLKQALLFSDDAVSFDSVITLLGYLKEKNADVTASVDALLTKALTTVSEGMLDKLSETVTALTKLATNFKIRGTETNQNNFVANLPYTSKQLLKSYYESTDKPIPAEVARFFEDMDFYTLMSSAKRSNMSMEEIRIIELIGEAFYKVTGLLLAQKVLNSKLDTNKLLKFKEGLEVLPSLQQNIAMTQAITFLMAPNRLKGALANWLVVRGIGGSGKTHFLGAQLINLYTELTGEEGAQFFAFAKEEAATNNLRIALNSNAKIKTSYQILKELPISELKKFSAIIIDEIFTFTNEEITEIDKIASEAGLKVIALGDPSQITADPDPILLKALKPTHTIPLTTSYRTNVSAISSFLGNYRLQPNFPVNPVATANVDSTQLVEDPAKAFGVISTDEATVMAAISRPSSRSRVLIVATQSVANDLQSKVPKGVDVRTPQNAQGIQWDEVYSLLPSPADANPFESNRFLYTAYSRAKALLVVADGSVLNADPSSTIDTDMVESARRLDDIATMFKQSLSTANRLRELLGLAPAIASEEVVITDDNLNLEPVTDNSVSGAMATQSVVITPDPIFEDQNPFELLEPENLAMLDYGNPANAMLTRMSQAYFVKTSNGSIWVLGKRRNNNKFFRIAKISQADFENPLLADFLNDITKAQVSKVDETELTYLPEFPLPNVANITAAVVTVTDFTKFKTLFSENQYFENQTQGDIIEDLIIRFYTTYFRDYAKRDKPWVTTKEINGELYHTVLWENIPKEAISLVVPTKKSQDAASKQKGYGWNDEYHNPGGLTIYHGIPYLVINPTETSKKPVLIRMQPKNIPVTHPYINVLRELHTTVKTIEKNTGLLLGTPEFAKLIEDYKVNNFTIKDGKLELIDSVDTTKYDSEVDTAIQKLVKEIYGVVKAPKEFRTEENAQKFLDENATPSGDVYLLKGHRVTLVQVAGNAWRFAVQRDTTDKNQVSYYEEDRIENGHGTAQKVLNSIAKANNRIDEAMIRQSSPSSKKAGIRISRSPSILESDAYTDYHGFYKDPVVGKYFDEARVNKYLNLASDPEKREGSLSIMMADLRKRIQEVDGVTEPEASIMAEKMLGYYTTDPISSALLEMIIGDKAFDSNGRHNSLRIPLYLNVPKKKDKDGNLVHSLESEWSIGLHDIGNQLDNKDVREVLTKLLKHSFEGVQRTRVFIDNPKLVKPKVEPTKKLPRHNKLSDLLKAVKPTGNPVYDNILSFLDRHSVDAELMYFQEGFSVEINGVTEHRKAASTLVTAKGTIIQAHAIDFTDVNSNRDKLHILLHEAMHAASKAALAKGKADQRKGLDTKEALLYRRMISIKKRFDSAIRSRKNEKGERLKTSDVYQKTFSKYDVDEFVANLANPEFVEFAKSISLVPSGPRKSLLREILEAIVNYFKSILGDNPSVYDAAIASLEEFYATNDVVIPEAVTPSVIYKIEDVLNDLNSKIADLDEYEFDTQIPALKAKYTGIIDPTSYPSNYGDPIELLPSLDFLIKSPEEKSLMIAATKATPSGAWYNVPADKVSFSSGLIDSSFGVFEKVDGIIPADFTREEKTLVRSIARIALQESGLLEEILIADRDEFIDLLYKHVFSNADKTKFRMEARVSKDSEIKDMMKSGEYLQESLDRVRDLIIDVPVFDRLLMILDGVKDQGVSKYKAAKSFVEKLITDNLKLDNDLTPDTIIKTPLEIREYLREQLTSPDFNPVLPSGNTLVDARKKLKQLTSQPTTLENIQQIEELETELAALAALKSKDQKSRKLIIDLVLKDIYPNTKFTSLQDFETELFELSEEDKISKSEAAELLDVAGISEYMKKYDQSYENTLSESLKNSFRKITLGNKTISPGLAYVKTLQIVMGLDWNLLPVTSAKGRKSHGLDYIAEQLREELKATSSELSKAIITNLLDAIRYSKNVNFSDVSIDNENSEYAYGIISVKAPNGAIKYAAYKAHKSIPKHFNLTYQKIEYLMNNGEDVRLITKLTDKSDVLFEALSKEGFDMKAYNRLFMKGEASNVVRAVMNTMGSMKETFLYTANRSNKKGLELKFQRGIASGVSSRVKEHLKSNLVRLYEENKLESLEGRFNARKVGEDSMKIIEDTNKYLYIKLFFEELGISVSDFVVRKAEFVPLIEDIKAFMQRAKNIERYSLEEELNETSENKFDITEWLESSEGVDGYLNNFSKIISSSDRLARNPSVRDAYGNKFYVYHESSHFYDTMLNLINLDSKNPVFYGGTGSDKARAIPEFIKTDYYNHNIFVRSKKVTNQLHAAIEIDGSRNLGNNSVTEYTKENMFFFFQRNFNHQFIDGLRQFKKSYFQSTYIPSDSPKALAVRVNILSDNADEMEDTEIFKAIESMFLQILEKRDLSGAPINNFDTSNQADLFRNFHIGKKAVDKLADQGVKFTEENIPKLAAFVYEQLSVDASELLDELLSEDVQLTLDINTYTTAAKAVSLMNKRFSSTTELYSKTNKAVSYTKGKTYAVDKNMLLPIFELWYKNDVINSYFLNQLVTGDYSAYKSSGQIIKRFAGVKGPRIKGLIDTTVGMNPTYKTLILSDNVYNAEDLRPMLSKLLYGDEVPEQTPELDQVMDFLKERFEATDAQGFMMPRRMADLSMGYESAWGLGDVTKPIQFGAKPINIDGYTTASPDYVKYSTINLSKDLISKFPALKTLHDIGVKLDVDEIVFKTGYKLGQPITLDENGDPKKSPSLSEILAYSDEDLRNFKDKWQRNSIVELSNNSFGFQFNAQANPLKQVSIFTQLMYMINAYPDELSSGAWPNVQEAARELYGIVGELIKSGKEEFMNNVVDEKSFVKFLKANLKGSGSERALQLLEGGVSIDNPLIERKAIIALASGLEKATIKTKFKGGKLVLQTPEGIAKYQDTKLFEKVDPKKLESLSYRKEKVFGDHEIIVAEVIVPAELLTKEQKDMIGTKNALYLMPDMLGFRIPSTDFHSAVAMRVVGVYSDKATNVIIGPKELVPIQGQDQNQGPSLL